MRAVLYTSDLEPITVVELHPQLWRRLEAGETLKLAVLEPLRPWEPQPDPVHLKFRTVRLTGEPVRRRGAETLMLFTPDEEDALLLKAAFLPGQRRELGEREARAFARGVLKALSLGL